MTHVAHGKVRRHPEYQAPPFPRNRAKDSQRKKVFSVRFVDQKAGRTLKERSSGQTSRSAAVRCAEAEIEKIWSKSGPLSTSDILNGLRESPTPRYAS